MSKIVYHYTSPEGILSILENKTLRFTDCQYLNDTSEFIYISEPFAKAIEKISKKYNVIFDNADVNFTIKSLLTSPYQIDEVDYAKIMKEKSGAFNEHVKSNTKTYRYYVFCCSKNEDASNMWNYFVKNGVYRGYNLGIDSDVLRDKFNDISACNKKIKIFSKEITYSFNKQVDIIFNKLDEIITDKHGELSTMLATNDMDILNKIRFGCWEFIHMQKLFFKNPAFESEKEYRFVLKVDNDFNECDKLSMKFRVGDSGVITPFIEWSYSMNDKRELFKQITLAPMIESNLAEESFKRFLDTTVYQGLKIKPSSIKMRF